MPKQQIAFDRMTLQDACKCYALSFHIFVEDDKSLGQVIKEELEISGKKCEYRFNGDVEGMLLFEKAKQTMRYRSDADAARFFLHYGIYMFGKYGLDGVNTRKNGLVVEER